MVRKQQFFVSKILRDLYFLRLENRQTICLLLVILPQALKLVIPGVANTFLALVKDTPLILVVGLLELVGMIDMAKSNPDWLGFATEGYIFAGVVFWIICFNMSRYSQRLEKKYKTDR